AGPRVVQPDVRLARARLPVGVMSVSSCAICSSYFCVFVSHAAPTEASTLSLHDALPISRDEQQRRQRDACPFFPAGVSSRHPSRSEEHTSELQSRENLVCRLLLEKKKNHSAGAWRGARRGAAGGVSGPTPA